MKLVNIIFLFCLLSFTSCTFTRYYVVRHAEKSDNSEDPPLNEDGQRRAKTLADTLKKKKINRIFISNRQRTAQTAQPTASLFSIEPLVVPENETAVLIKGLKKISNKKILVVRHSPEIHLIVNALSPFDQIEQIGNEFHLMFVVTRRSFLWQKRYNLKRLTYGEH
jgi:phosphohistidine phosphatase SixA